tara:strand:+ start:763 stop:1197 length:435 start_codon:yes stop_codon:yes gene_type:complete
MKQNQFTKVKFPKIKTIGKRSWGKEELLALIPKKISLKKIFIKKGKKGGLQYHHKKNECGILIYGKLKVTFDNGKGKLISKILKKNSAFHFPPKAAHQEEALSDCLIIEASTPYFNDRVRVEKKYGLKEPRGLPSTKKKEVKLL